MSARSLLLASLLASTLAGGCRPPAATGPDPLPGSSGDACWFGDPPRSGNGGAVSLALLEPVDASRAPLGRNPSERWVFAQVYETLVALDCEGLPQPGLARSWSFDASASRWTFVLREDARLSDGTPVTGRVVVDAWSAARRRAPSGRRGIAGAPWAVFPEGSAWAGGDSVFVSVPAPIAADGGFFADPWLAVAVGEGPRPLGTGPFRWGDGAEPRLVPNPNHPARAVAEIELRIHEGGDPRDVLGAGADLALVSDRKAVEYARGTTTHTVLSLPWSRRYAGWFSPGGGIPPAERAGLAEELATTVAVSEARPAPGWPYAECRGIEPEAPSRPGGDLIEYPAGDPDAKAIAARLVALAGTDPAPAWLQPFRGARAREAPPAELARRVVSGEVTGLVVFPHALLPDPCPPPGQGGFGALDPVPLLDTRAHLVARKGLQGFVLDGFGNVLLSRVVRDPTP